MKNTIEYYYDVNVSKIHQNGKKYYFSYEGYNYFLLPIQDTNGLKSIYELSIYLFNNNVLSHQIIITKQNELFIKTNDENYILLKVYVNKNKIGYEDIFKLNSIMFAKKENDLRRDNWYLLWTNKVDYFEYQINQMGKKYPLIRNSFSYYIGLAENAICLFNITKKDNLSLTLSHKRIKSIDSTYELYNPLNFVIDYKVRDICEYFKDSFFNNSYVENSIEQYLYYNSLSYDECCIFFSRLLFPSYYFDMYEDIVINKVDENQINKIISKANDYEKLLKKVYYLLRQSNKLPEIEWLN